MPKLKSIITDENGQAIALLALVLAVLMGMGALVVDVGSAYLAKSNLQNAADTAALAAAENLPNASSAVSTAITYAGKNGMKATMNGVTASGDTVTVTTPYNGDSGKVKVVCTRNVAFTFGRFFGYSSKDVSASAVAALSTASYPAFNFALFSGGGQVGMNGNSHTVTGNIYGYTGVNIAGKKSVVNGIVEAGNNNISVPSGTTTIPNTTIAMPDLSSLIKTQGTKYTSAQVQQLISSGATVSGPIYVDGDLTINGRVKGTTVIYASGNISFGSSFAQQATFY